ncbi:MAG: hypothetical protein DMF66_19575 [Acidobacteria bacterium]|nr:MAG: hypothetical protein DMF66_19575 [Acidobacteriota bacterium]
MTPAIEHVFGRTRDERQLSASGPLAQRDEFGQLGLGGRHTHLQRTQPGGVSCRESRDLRLAQGVEAAPARVNYGADTAGEQQRAYRARQ